MNFNHLPVIPLRITSRFGKRNTGIQGASTNHKGIDIGGSGPNTPLYAVRRGTVVKNYWNNVRGWVVVIKHDDTYETLYQHLKEKSPLAIGTYVESGSQIGIMGNSSNTIKCGVHLHFELHLNGTPINPEPFLLNIKGVEEDMTEKELRAIIRTEIADILKGNSNEPSSWAKDTWDKATKDGIVDGTNPKGYPTREQVATMLERFK